MKKPKTVGHKLKTLSSAAVLNEGEDVAFTVETEDGRRLVLNCSLPEIGDIFNFLGHLAKAAGEERTVPVPTPPAGYNYLAPVPATGIGFQGGTTPDETLLVIRLAAFDLAFSVPSSGLARLADEIGRMARTLSAGSGKPQ
jgi:hypothetical protein